MARTPASTSDRLLTVAQLCEKWGWSQQQLRRLVQAREIPHLRLGRRHHAIHFRESAVEAWLREREVPVVTETVTKAAAVLTREEECRRLGIPVDHPYS
jgi:excisionase family DNA binding protein